MKKLSRLSLLAVSTLALVGCATQQAESKEWKPSMPESTESQAPVSSEADSYVEPSYPAEEAPSYSLPKQPKPEEPEPYNPVWQGFEPEDPVIEAVTEEEGELSVQKIAEDICTLMWGEDYTLDQCYANGIIEDNGDGSYYVGCNFGVLDASYIDLVHEQYVVAAFMPDYLDVFQEVGHTAVTGTTDCYVCYWADENVDYIVQEMVYVLSSSGKLSVQMIIGEYEYFIG